MFEVEQKLRIEAADPLCHRLAAMGSTFAGEESHADTYYNHPCRDFAQSREAFRVRRIDGVPWVTYKGPKLPGAVKARRELEWRLDPGDPTGESMESLLEALGFRPLATVRKRRRTFTLGDSDGELTVAVDEVEGLGEFAEIELMTEGHLVERSRGRVEALAERLEMRTPEPKSYLALVLERLPAVDNRLT